MNLVPSTSLTHEHILSVINTELKANARGDVIHILDAGCGSGLMLKYLYQNLKILWPKKTFHFCGFDVGDHATQSEGFFDNALNNLNEVAPDYDWSHSLHLIRQSDSWPFKDHQFDFIVSNQVLEHVFTGDHFFSELHRCLKDDGFSTHLFPVRECIYDGHVFMPWVHRFESKPNLAKFMFATSLFGIGSYWHFLRDSQQKFSFSSLNQWSQNNASYIVDSCHYMPLKQIRSLSSRNGFEIDYNHTSEFYIRKFNQIANRESSFEYTPRGTKLDRLSFPFLKKINCITLNLRPCESPLLREHSEKSEDSQNQAHSPKVESETDRNSPVTLTEA